MLDSSIEIFAEVFGKLFSRFAQEQIRRSFKKEHADEPLKWISHKTIYKYIYAFFVNGSDVTLPGHKEW